MLMMMTDDDARIRALYNVYCIMYNVWTFEQM